MASRFEPFLINPPRRLFRRTRKLKARRRARRNPMIDDPKEVAKFEKQWNITAGAHKRTKRVAKLSSARGKKRTKRRIVKRRKGISHAAAVKRARKAWRTRLAKSRGRKVTMAKRGRKRARKRTYRRRTKRVVTRHARMRSQFYRPKRRIKRGSLKRRKKYMIAAYKHRGHLYTAPNARRVWPNHRLNPFGSEMMTIGANPRRRKRRRSRRSYKSNPRRRYMARGRRRFSRNPLASMRHLLPMIAAGTAGALATRNLPRMLGVTSPWATYGTQVVVIFGGGYLADKFMGREVSDGWVIGGATSILSGVVAGLTGGFLQGLGLDYEAFPNEVGAFPMGMLGDGAMGDGMGANEFEPSMVY